MTMVQVKITIHIPRLHLITPLVRFVRFLIGFNGGHRRPVRVRNEDVRSSI